MTWPRLLSAALLVASAACAQSDSTPGAASPRLTALIVHDTRAHSGFKDGVVKRLRDTLATAGYTVTVTDLRDLKREAAPDYGTIVVLDAIEGAKLQPAVEKYISTAADKQVDSRVLVATVSGDDWRDKRTDIEAITGASRSMSVEGVVSRIAALVRATTAARPPTQ